MDAREALRRYLEQRRDLGESELVLDSMSVDEALTLLGAVESRSAPGGPRAGPAATSRSNAAAPADAGDWRAAVRAAGGGPEQRVPRPAPAPPHQVPSPSAARTGQSTPDDTVAAASLDDVPAGLVVGGASRAPSDDPIRTLATIADLAAAVANCRRCPLYATATNPVPGAGNPDADFMIVGEAPGANEDAQGVPFVGQAGQLLTKIIEAIDLRRDDVFIANVLKHRPPGNRNPLPEEVTACSPYLVRQIELVRPMCCWRWAPSRRRLYWRPSSRSGSCGGRSTATTACRWS